MPVKIAVVAVENTVYHFDKKFSYLIKDTDADCIGSRVLVPFGKGNRLRQGVVFAILDTNDAGIDVSTLKSVKTILDKKPVLNAEMIKMCEFMKNHYFCTYYDCIKTMLPAGINYKISSVYSVRDDLNKRLFDLSDEERRIVKYILSVAPNPIEEDKILTAFGYDNNFILEKLCADDILVKSDTALRKLGDKTMKMVRLKDGFDALPSDIKLTEKQQSVFDLIYSVGSASVKEACYYTGVTSSVVESLVKKGIAEYFDDEIFRIPNTAVSNSYNFVLTDEQKRAYDELYSLYNDSKPQVSLLYGITGSGKTSVFFKLIEKAVSDEKDVIVMVPEIALTPQLISIFKSKFSDKVAIFHSALSLGERLDEYKRVKLGLAKIAIGTRSAIFAPFSNLGLIIMDEEQEHTYKSESNPRFHARDLAKFRCSYNRCLLILSSATPSIETFYNANIGKYHKSVLINRYGKARLPDVFIADMNLEIANGNFSEFSNLLLESIEDNLENKKQSIILLNRRGHNTFVTCNNCKEPITCPNCSITLTYHKDNNRLMCHYCGYSIEYIPQCPSCQSRSLRLMGSGTQKAESDISNIFPYARVLRMDTDSTMSKSSHEKKLSEFANGEYDILIGTQMVAKGLNFPNVTLVGVLNADGMLYMDDYRSYENTFSLLTQVVGRSGRGENKGRAIIQTFTPDNPIISLASQQNYDAFYKSEIEVRKALLYPPFVNLCIISFLSNNGLKAKNASFEFLKALTDSIKKDYPYIPIRILGPAPSKVFKVNNKYTYKLIIKCRNDLCFREMLSRVLIDFANIKEYKDVSTFADMNPINI